MIMKKIYKKPTIASADYLLETVMQTGSPREAAGGPVDEGLPGQMGETDGTTDPFGGHGQGSGGGGNRVKQHFDLDLW